MWRSIPLYEIRQTVLRILENGVDCSFWVDSAQAQDQAPHTLSTQPNQTLTQEHLRRRRQRKLVSFQKSSWSVTALAPLGLLTHHIPVSAGARHKATKFDSLITRLLLLIAW